MQVDSSRLIAVATVSLHRMPKPYACRLRYMQRRMRPEPSYSRPCYVLQTTEQTGSLYPSREGYPRMCTYIYLGFSISLKCSVRERSGWQDYIEDVECLDGSSLCHPSVYSVIPFPSYFQLSKRLSMDCETRKVLDRVSERHTVYADYFHTSKLVA